MANREKGYGLTAEVSARIDSKYSTDDEEVIVVWMNAILGESPQEKGRKGFHQWLQDGLVLCRLMNSLKPGSVPKTHDPSTVKLAAMKKNKEMENISFFLKAAENYGVGKTDLFQTVDLYEDQNMAQVQSTLYKLSGASMKNGYSGPQIGVKIASENKRNMDEEKLREGRNVIGLQMGTNQVASQKGMTTYGLGRQIVNK